MSKHGGAMVFNENQKIKDLVRAAKRDPDSVTAFYFGDGFQIDGAIIVITPKTVADMVIKWLLNQRLLTNRSIPAVTESDALSNDLCRCGHCFADHFRDDVNCEVCNCRGFRITEER